MSKYIQLGTTAGDPAAINDYALYYYDSTADQFKLRRPLNAGSNPGGIETLTNILNNPMTTPQDLIVGGVGGTPSRLGIGSNGQVLTVAGGVIDWGAPGSFSPDRTFIVAKAGGSHTTIAAAIAAANGLLPAPSATNPALIVVYPGVYSEPALTLNSGVHMFGHNRQSAVISAAVTTQTILTIKANASARNFKIQGANTATGIGVLFDSGSSPGGEIENILIDDCYIGVRTSGGTTARTDDVRIINSILADLDLTTLGDTLEINGVEGDRDKVQFVPGSELAGYAFNRRAGERQLVVTAELSVGLPTNPRETALGGGDSHVTGMHVFRNTNLEVGVWSDITTEMKSSSGSSANMFSGTAINNTIYFGGLMQFPGIKTDTETALVLGSGQLIWEYWDGSTWQPLAIFATKASSPYTVKANSPFLVTESDQIRFGFTDGWALKTLNGENKYWVRVRIADDTITVNPLLQSVKLHTNRTEINSDGFLEYFGAARPTRTLPEVHLRLTDDAIGFNPANENINYSANVGLTPLDNEFQNGAHDGLGGVFTLEEGIDTSFPIQFDVFWHPFNNAAGNVELDLVHTQASPGDILDGTLAEATETQLIAVNNQQDELIKTSFQLDLQGQQPGDLIPWVLKRDATGGNPADTYGNNIAIAALRATARFWR